MNEINGNEKLNNIYEEKTKESDVAIAEQSANTSAPEPSLPPKKQKKRFSLLPIIGKSAFTSEMYCLQILFIFLFISLLR